MSDAFLYLPQNFFFEFLETDKIEFSFFPFIHIPFRSYAVFETKMVFQYFIKLVHQNLNISNCLMVRVKRVLHFLDN